jgi:hypothetical protein
MFSQSAKPQKMNWIGRRIAPPHKYMNVPQTGVRTKKITFRARIKQRLQSPEMSFVKS